ncbi:MAG TPA: hypothetical protein VK541_20695 [Pedobacter sp.]|uniref:HYC_CC_PP family protein n=1 Tax=Pedobacter sp. TaxID=1411316 RepID=UPI002C347A62|nr:hypothetical protein [Pedobacter sp.]HMI04919.1 hypothetical protein [Pedobacter sp.]
MKMKQKIAMGLCVFYLVSVIGLAVSMHFCAGKLSSVRFIETAKCKTCTKDSKIAKSHSCCKTTSVGVKIKDSHQAGAKVKMPGNFSLQLFLGTHLTDVFKVILPKSLRLEENKAPPLSSIISLHLFNCVFRN